MTSTVLTNASHCAAVTVPAAETAVVGAVWPYPLLPVPVE